MNLDKAYVLDRRVYFDEEVMKRELNKKISRKNDRKENYDGYCKMFEKVVDVKIDFPDYEQNVEFWNQQEKLFPGITELSRSKEMDGNVFHFQHVNGVPKLIGIASGKDFKTILKYV